MTHADGSSLPTGLQRLTATMRFGLAKGITPRQLLVLLFMFVTIRAASEFIVLMQPFILNVQLAVPRGEQGRITGAIGSAQQIVLLVTSASAGTLSDRIGRRRMMIAAMAGMAACAFAFPLVGAIAALVAVRMLFGLANTAYTAGGVPLIHDFPDDRSRGRFVAFIIVMNLVSSALLVGFIGARLPLWLVGGGLSQVAAGRVAFLIYGAVAIAGLLAAWLAFREPPGSRTPRKGGNVAQTVAQLREVIAHGRANPRFGILIILSFVTRADTAVLQSFLVLWVVNAGAAQGIPAATATATAGTLLVILNVASFVMPPLFGTLADRWDKMPMLLFSLVAGGLAFTAPLVVTDPFGWPVVGVVILIGIAEGAQTISSQAMFGQEAPAHLRGSAFGLFTIFGTVSVVAVTAVGGLLFDKAGYGAPFALVGALNFLFLAIIWFLLARARRRTRHPLASRD